VTGSNGICSTSDTISVTVNPLPVLVATSVASTICEGESATLIASGADSYSWNTNQTGATTLVTPATTTTYTVIGTTNTCSDTATITIIVNPVAVVTAGSDQTICS